MPSENDERAQADVSRGDTAARVGQPNRDRPDEEGGHAGGGDRMQRVSHGDRADRGARWNRGDRPYVDAQVLTDAGARVYEAVATLEYAGRPVTRREVMEATDLDDATVVQILHALTDQGVLTSTATGDGDVFALSRRDWSATPDTPAG